MIKLMNIKKSFPDGNDERIILKDFSISINDGEFVAIMGTSGSGKTTLLNIIGCLDSFSEGKYYLDKYKIHESKLRDIEKIRNKNISYIFQDYELIDNCTVYENIEIPLLAKKICKKERKEKIEEILIRLGIKDIRNKIPLQISGGEKQRTAIARALVANKKYILADEPTGALDGKNTERLLEILKEIHEDSNITIIMVTHDENVAKIADRIIRI